MCMCMTYTLVLDSPAYVWQVVVCSDREYIQVVNKRVMLPRIFTMNRLYYDEADEIKCTAVQPFDEYVYTSDAILFTYSYENKPHSHTTHIEKRRTDERV